MRGPVVILTACLLAPMLGLTAAALTSPPQTAVVTCSVLYRNGIDRMERGNYAEALKDFEQVTAASACTSNLKADASLRKGDVYLALSPPRISEARQVATYIGQIYGQPSAQAGLAILVGRINLVEARTSSQLEGALNVFERASVLAKGTPDSAAAAYYAGETLRLAHRHEDALTKYREALLTYPDSIWAARALLGTTHCYVRRSGQHELAMEALQQVQRKFPDTVEAGIALNWSTILYRLRVRPSNEAPFLYSGKTFGSNQSKFRHSVGVLIDRQGRLIVAHRDGWSVFSDAPERVVRADQRYQLPSAVSVAPNGTIVVAHEIFIEVDHGQEVHPVIPRSNGQPKPVKVAALVATRNGGWLVADDETREIHEFVATFNASKRFAGFAASRLAVNEIDDVAALGKRSIVLFGREGGDSINEIARPALGNQVGELVDIAFDPLANLYVLDRSRRVYVLDPELKPIRTFQLPAKGAGSLEDPSAIGIDAAGRLYICGNDMTGKQRVLVYQ